MNGHHKLTPEQLLVAFVVAPLAPMLVIGRAALKIAPQKHAKRREPQ